MKLDLLCKLVGEGKDIIEIEHNTDRVAIFEDVVQEWIVFSYVELVVYNYLAVFYLFVRYLKNAT